MFKILTSSLAYRSLVLACLLTPAMGCNKKSESTGSNDSNSSSSGGVAGGPRWATDGDFAALRQTDLNNLKMIGMGMHLHADARQGALPATICDASGKPLLSWRVALLPYVEQHSLYANFKLEEPWDSEHNKALISQMPKIYVLPGSGSEKEGKTNYRVFVAPIQNQGARPIFAKAPVPQGMKFQNPFKLFTIPDGTSNTILVAESAEAVIWTKPEELDYDPKKPLPKLGYFWKDNMNVAMGDGSVRGVSIKVSEKTLRDAITADDGQVLGSDW